MSSSSKMIAYLSITLAVTSAFAGSTTINVSPDGISPAQALETLRGKGGTICVAKGLYSLEAPLVHTKEHSNVKWVGEDGAVLSGGMKVDGWRDAGDGTWLAPFDGCVEELWVNGRRADCSRLPKSGKGVDSYLKIADASCEPAADGKSGFVLTVKFNDPAVNAIVGGRDVWLSAVHKWTFFRTRISKATRNADGTVTVVAHQPFKWSYKWTPETALLFFENAGSDSLAEGEWLCDSAKRELRYRPRTGERIGETTIIVPRPGMDRLIIFDGNPAKGEYVDNVSFRNIGLEYTAPSSEKGFTAIRPHQAASRSSGAVTGQGIRNARFTRCRIAHTGNYAVRMSEGCVSNRFTECTMEDLGAGGMWIGALRAKVPPSTIGNNRWNSAPYGRRIITELLPESTAFNAIENCTIRNGGRFNPEGTGIVLTHASDTRVIHCDIHDLYYSGVSVGWVWGFTGSVAQRNEIAFNRIYDLGKGIMSDMGGVYTLGTSFGTRVHDNVIYDVNSYSYGGWGLYNDEGSEGVVMERNLVYNTTDGSYHQHFGANNLIRNNIFAWNRMTGAVRTQRDVVFKVPCSTELVNNIILVDGTPLTIKGVQRVGGVWAGNLWYDVSGKKPDFGVGGWNEWRESGREVLGEYADPLFVDAKKHDFRLKKGSPAFRLGFKEWDFSAAGRRSAAQN